MSAICSSRRQTDSAQTAEVALPSYLVRLSVSGRTSSCTQRGGRCQKETCSGRQSDCLDSRTPSVIMLCSTPIPNTPVYWFDDPGSRCDAAQNADLHNRAVLSTVSRTVRMRMTSHHDRSHRGRVQMQLVLQKIGDCKPRETQNALHQVDCMRKHKTVFPLAHARLPDHLRTALMQHL